MLLDDGKVKFSYDGTYLKAYTWVEDTPSSSTDSGSETIDSEDVPL